MIKVAVDSADVIERFNKIAARSSDLSAPLAEVGEIALSSIEKNFQVEGRYREAGDWRGGTKKWDRDLSDSYKRSLVGGSRGYTLGGQLRAKSKRRLAGKKILTESGQLGSSITKYQTKSTVAVGTNKVYAAAHNYGVDENVTVKEHTRTSSKGKQYKVKSHKRHMVLKARPFLVIQDEDIKEMVDALDDHIMKE